MKKKKPALCMKTAAPCLFKYIFLLFVLFNWLPKSSHYLEVMFQNTTVQLGTERRHSLQFRKRLVLQQRGCGFISRHPIRLHKRLERQSGMNHTHTKQSLANF